MAQNVDVRGIVSMQNQQEFLAEISTKSDAPRFNVKMIDTKRAGQWADAPHHKLIVIDGLFAITGSTNLTTQGWRQVANGKDHVEAITDIDRVKELHNRYFSPIWFELKKESTERPMDSITIDEGEIPF